MEVNELRLELLKLAYTHGRTSAEAVDRAKELEQYVTGQIPEAAPSEAGEPPKRRPGRPRKSDTVQDLL